MSVRFRAARVSRVSTVWCVAIFLTGCASGSVQAQVAGEDDERRDRDTAGLVVEAAAGWDGTVDRTTPVPISLLLSNFSDRLIEGELFLTDPLNGFRESIGEVAVASQTTRRVAVIRDMEDWFECYVSLESEGQVLWRRELSLATGNDFDSGLNYLLFVSDGGRALQSGAPVLPDPAVQQSGLGGTNGRPVRSLTIKSFQIPDHPGPMAPVQTVVFPNMDARALNRTQWRALAEWVCQGGLVFMHAESTEVAQRLLDEMPLSPAAAVDSHGFAMRRAGLGAICEYTRPLFSADGSPTVKQIEAMTARASRDHITTLLDSGNLHNIPGGRSDINRALIVIFFVVYALMSGLVTLLLFRRNPKRVVMYTAVVVATACVLSAVLGGFLRMSRGDVRWVTLTQPGAGGLVQIGQLEVQSGGGRNTRVAVQGRQPDLQFTGRSSNRYYYWGWQETSYPRFTWQPNAVRPSEDTYQALVPITPFGRRTLQATGYVPDTGRLEFELKFEPDAEQPTPDPNQTETDQPANIPAGKFTLKIVNKLPFDVHDCQVIIGATQRTVPNPQGGPIRIRAASPFGPGIIQTLRQGDAADVYHAQGIPILTAREDYETTFVAEFQSRRDNWNSNGLWPYGTFSLPRVPHKGAISAWVVGRLKKSPTLSIAESQSDFVEQEHVHLFMQEIRPEDMTNAEAFLLPDDERDETKSNDQGQQANGGQPKDAGGQPDNGQQPREDQQNEDD